MYNPAARWEPSAAAYLSEALGPELWEATVRAAPVPPLETCLRVNPLRLGAEEAAERLRRELGPEWSDRVRTLPELPEVVLVRGSGPHALSSAEAEGREVMVSRKAGEAVLRGAHVFVPGVLACSAGVAPGDLVAVTVAPQELESGSEGFETKAARKARLAGGRREAGGEGGEGEAGVEARGAEVDTQGAEVEKSSAGAAGERGAETAGPESASEEACPESRPTSSAARSPARPITRGGHPPPDPQGRRLTIALGRLALSRSDVFKARSGVAVLVEKRVFAIPPCHGLLPGMAMLQNLPSAAAAAALDPAPGSKVLDMCASPGGKTTALAARMQDRGFVLALDRSHAKARDVRLLAEELGLSCILACKGDACKVGLQREQVDQEGSSQLAKELTEGQRRMLERKAANRAKHGHPPLQSALLEENREPLQPPTAPESFDYVLLDAPCSALGLRPRLAHAASAADLAVAAGYQRQLLRAAVRALRPGGALVYSTCSVDPGENEANVRWALDAHGGALQLEGFEPRLGGPGLTGTIRAQGREIGLLAPQEASLVQRFGPGCDLDSIGFFIARFRKLRSTEAEARGADGEAAGAKQSAAM